MGSTVEGEKDEQRGIPGLCSELESRIPLCGFLEFDMREGSNAVEAEK